MCHCVVFVFPINRSKQSSDIIKLVFSLVTCAIINFNVAALNEMGIHHSLNISCYIQTLMAPDQWQFTGAWGIAALQCSS